MYHRIVVGTDGSVTASRALAHALFLAKETGATLHVVTAWSSLPALALSSALGAAGLPPADDGRWVNTLHEEVVERSTQHKVSVVPHAVEGDAAGAVLDVARSVDADLIVVGNVGLTGLRGHLGSVPSHVVHHAPCAVLVVPTS